MADSRNVTKPGRTGTFRALKLGLLLSNLVSPLESRFDVMKPRKLEI